MKQMFDIIEQSDEIYGVKNINWEDSSWKYWSLIGDEQVISFLRAKIYIFSDLVLSLGKMNENPHSKITWKNRLTWLKSAPQYKLWTQLMVSRWNSSEIFSQDSPHFCFAKKSKSSCLKWAINQTNAQLVSLCKEIRSRTMVIPRTWIGEKVTLY